MAPKKPAIGFGPIGDDVAKLLKKALSGAMGVAKSDQGKRVIRKLETRAGLMQPRGNPARASVDKAKKQGEKLRTQLKRTDAKKADTKLTNVLSKAHMADMKKGGKNWDGSPTKATIDAVKKNAKSGKENVKLGAAFVQKAKDDKIITSYGKQIGRGEVMGKRGTGRYVSTTGRVKYVPKDAAAKAASESTGIEKGVAKRARTDGQKNVDLKKAVADAKTPEARREARKVLRAHQDRTGFR